MNTNVENSIVRQALKLVDEAEQKAQAAIASVYPKGREIRWERGRGVQIGNVIGHSNFRAGQQIKVTNMHTQKSYWIWVGDIRE